MEFRDIKLPKFKLKFKRIKFKNLQEIFDKIDTSGSLKFSEGLFLLNLICYNSIKKQFLKLYYKEIYYANTRC